MTIAVPTSPAIPAIADDVPEFRRSILRRAWIFCRRQPLGTFGLLIVVITAIAGLSADWIAPYSPTANDFSSMTEAPSWAHWLGTDQFGRDQFSRIIFGARTALIVGVLALTVVLIFIIQNAHAVSISFLGAHLHLSLAVALLFAAIAGVIAVAIVGAQRAQ